MPSVDNRVVEMRFDNKEFETGVSESISSLDKLKKSLKFKDEVEGLDEIDRAAESVNKKFSVLGTISDQLFRNLANEIYQVKNQFVGMVKALSTDQIAAGWDKYAVKTQAVQTIMAATASQIEDEGERMEYVNEQLDRLNWFADETSASLMDMTTNIGKFTNNGVELESAVTSMQGIANWGYLSGANINEMSRAMYNLSQALSVGAVTLIDWKSIENANMATVEFKQTALDTAVAVGTLTKVSDGLYKTLEGHDVTLSNFNQYLTQDRWFNKDVLTKTLDKYGAFTNELAAEIDKIDEAGGNLTTSKFLEYIEQYVNGTLNLNEATKRTGLSADELITDLEHLSSAEYTLGRKAFAAAQEAKTFTEAIEATKDAVSSKWMQTFEIIFGDYQSAKKLWTKLSNELWELFAAGGEARNDMLREWANSESGGYKVFWDSVWNIWEGLKGIGSRIKAAWKAIFPGLDSKKLIDLTEKLYDFSVKFKNRFAEVEETLENVATVTGTFITKTKDSLGIFFDDHAPGEVINELGNVTDASNDYIQSLARTIPVLKELEEAVWGGKYGVNPERREALEAEGYNYELIQNAVNETANDSFRYEIAEEDLAKAMAIVNGEMSEQTESLGDLKNNLHGTSGQVKETRTWIDDLRDVLGGLRSAIDLVIEGGKLAVKYLVVPAWNFLVNVFKKILSVIAPFSRAFSDFVNRLKESKTITRNIEKISEWFNKLKENLKGQENIQKFLGYFGEFKDNLSEFKDKALDRVIEFFDKIVNLDIDLPDVTIVGEWIDGIVGYVNPAIEKLKEFEGFWPKIKAFFQGLDFSGAKNFGKSAGEGISEFLKTLFTDEELKETGKNWFGAIWEGFKTKIQEIDWGEVIGLVGKAIGTSVLVRLGWSIASFFNSISNIGRGTIGFFENIGQALHGFSKAMQATAFLEIAVGIGILAVAMIALTKVNQENLANVAVDIALVIAALALLMKVLGGTGKFFSDNTKFKKIGLIQINISKLGLTLIGLGAALVGIGVAVAILSKVYQAGTLWKVFGFLAALFFGLTTFAVVLDQINVNGTKMMKIAGAFAILAIGLDLLVPAIVGIAGLAAGLYATNMGVALWSAVGIIILIMAAFTGMVALTRKADNVLAVAGAFAIFSLSLLLLTPALIALMTVLTSQNWWELPVIVLSIGALFLAFGGVIALIAKVGHTSKKIESGIKAVLAIAVGIIAVAAALRILKGSTFGELMGIVGAIGILLGGLLLIVGLFSLVGGAAIAFPILVLSAAIALLGVAVLTAGVGVLAFAKALQILSDSSVDAKKTGKNLAEGIVAFFDELVENGRSIVKFIEFIVLAIAGVLIAKKANVVDAGAKIFNALTDKIVEVIEGSSGKMIFALAVLIAAAIAFMELNSESLITSILGIIGLIINGLAAGLLKTGGYIAQAIANLVHAVAHVLAAILDGALKEALENSNIGKFLQGFSLETLDRATEKLGLGKWTDSIFHKFFELGVATPRSVSGKTLEEDAADLQKSIDEVQTSLGNVVVEAKDNIILKSSEAKEAYEQAGKNVSAGVKSFDDTLYKIVEAHTGPVDINGVIFSEERANEIRNKFLKGIITPENIQMHIPELVDMNNSDITTTGGSIADGLFNILIKGLGDKVPEYTDNMFQAGADGTAGFTDGLLSGEEEALAAYQQLMGGGEDYVTGFLQEHSPSKLMANHGKNIVLGLALGILQTKPRLLSSMSSVFNSLNALVEAKVGEIKNTVYDTFYSSFNADDLFTTTQDRILEAFNAVVARISSAIDGNFDMSPVIRPVLDLSEIQNGSARIGSILGTNTYAFNPNLSYGIAGANNVVAATGQMNIRNSNIESSLSSLTNGMTQLNNDNRTIVAALSRYLPYVPELAHMQVTLDKRTLVGELTPAINAKLGDIALRKR